MYTFLFVVFFFFFKQKTAYEVRISDWSSDVCSSDLAKSICPASFLHQLAAPACQAAHSAGCSARSSHCWLSCVFSVFQAVINCLISGPKAESASQASSLIRCASSSRGYICHSRGLPAHSAPPRESSPRRQVRTLLQRRRAKLYSAPHGPSGTWT